MTSKAEMERDFMVPIWDRERVSKALDRFVEYAPGVISGLDYVDYDTKFMMLFIKFTVTVQGRAGELKQILNTIETEINNC